MVEKQMLFIILQVDGAGSKRDFVIFDKLNGGVCHCTEATIIKLHQMGHMIIGLSEVSGGFEFSEYTMKGEPRKSKAGGICDNPEKVSYKTIANGLSEEEYPTAAKREHMERDITGFSEGALYKAKRDGRFGLALVGPDHRLWFIKDIGHVVTVDHVSRHELSEQAVVNWKYDTRLLFEFRNMLATYITNNESRSSMLQRKNIPPEIQQQMMDEANNWCAELKHRLSLIGKQLLDSVNGAAASAAQSDNKVLENKVYLVEYNDNGRLRKCVAFIGLEGILYCVDGSAAGHLAKVVTGNQRFVTKAMECNSSKVYECFRALCQLIDSYNQLDMRCRVCEEKAKNPELSPTEKASCTKFLTEMKDMNKPNSLVRKKYNVELMGKKLYASVMQSLRR